MVFSAVASLAISGTYAQESGAGSAPPGAGRDERARYMMLGRRELELNTRFKLLSELGNEFQVRAEAARGTNRADLAEWESFRSKELMDRAASELTELNATTKQRQAIEDARRIVVPDPAVPEAIATNTVTPDEAAYLAKLEERMWELEKDLQVVLEEGKVFAAELATNNTPEDIGRISLQLDENGRAVRTVRRDIADLELRKLQFRALRRPK